MQKEVKCKCIGDFFWLFSSASHPLPCFVFVTQTFSAENEGYNGPEKDDEKAEPQSDEPLQADMKSDVSEKEDKDEENVQFLPAIGFLLVKQLRQKCYCLFIDLTTRDKQWRNECSIITINVEQWRKCDRLDRKNSYLFFEILTHVALDVDNSLS